MNVTAFRVLQKNFSFLQNKFTFVYETKLQWENIYAIQKLENSLR